MFDLIAAGLLLALILLSSLDGVYLHLWRYRLQERPDSRCEHVWHSARAWLFLPFLMVLAAQPSGWLLYTQLALVAVDLVAGLGDVLEEPKSRASLGGLSRGEYFLHVVLVMLHSSVLTLALAAQALPANLGLLPAQGLTAQLAGLIVPGTVLVALLHVWLIFVPQGLSQIERKLKGCCRPQAV